MVASIDLAVEGRGEIARAWFDPEGSRGEGMVLLPGGHLLVAKEKKPAALIEFGPPNSQSLGLVRGGALPDGERWPIKKGIHRFVALASWLPDKTLAKTCADFSDLEIGPDGCLYLLNDKSSTIARLGDLPAGGGAAALVDAWRLGDLDGKPEGLAAARPPARLRRRLQLRQTPQNPQRPDPIRIRLQSLDFRATQIQNQPAPANAGTKHLGRVAFGWNRHREERSDAAIQTSPCTPGLLRRSPPGRTGVFQRPMARNDDRGSTQTQFVLEASANRYCIVRPQPPALLWRAIACVGQKSVLYVSHSPDRS